MDSLFKTFGIQLFSIVLYTGMSLCFPLKLSICDIYNIFFTILIQCFTQNLFMFNVNFIQYDHLITVEATI